jgi:hypothetical protein
MPFTDDGQSYRTSSHVSGIDGIRNFVPRGAFIVLRFEVWKTLVLPWNEPCQEISVSVDAISFATAVFEGALHIFEESTCLGPVLDSADS